MKKKGQKSTMLLIVVFLTGLSLLLYPSISNYWNSMHQTQAITSYANAVSAIDAEKYDQLYQEAVAYNANLSQHRSALILQGDELKKYEGLLDVTGTGVMGYIDIPSIRVTLPIYHGTSDSVLQAGVGHLEWTSLPVGGESTHCVLSGHRGLPSSKLFTNLDDVVEGDTFMIKVLNEVLTYEVDQILIVLPEETEALQIEEGKDYCTLVTCTPYGINTHRLLVRGRRIETVDQAASARITADAIQMEELIVATVLAVPILLILLSVLLFDPKKRRKKSDSFS